MKNNIAESEKDLSTYSNSNSFLFDCSDKQSNAFLPT